LPLPEVESTIATQVNKGVLMKVSSLITGKAVYSVTAETSIATLVEKLASLKVGALVVSPDGIRIAGIVSERDIVAALPIHFHELGRLHVRDIMTVNVTTCTPNTTVAELMTLMTDRRIRHVPVVNEAGDLVSIVSIGDVVKSHVSEIDSERSALVDYVQNPR
jgi:CBS domain-containing protein